MTMGSRASREPKGLANELQVRKRVRRRVAMHGGEPLLKATRPNQVDPLPVVRVAPHAVAARSADVDPSVAAERQARAVACGGTVASVALEHSIRLSSFRRSAENHGLIRPGLWGCRSVFDEQLRSFAAEAWH